MAKRGPKIKQVNWTQVDAMCQIQCTQEEIAAVCGMSVDTLERRCKEEHGVKFADYFAEKRQGGRASLRRRQWSMAEKNPTMAIFLGKQYLGQADKVESEHSGPGGQPLVFQVVEKRAD